jgi:hypothetical protein
MYYRASAKISKGHRYQGLLIKAEQFLHDQKRAFCIVASRVQPWIAGVRIFFFKQIMTFCISHGQIQNVLG